MHLVISLGQSWRSEAWCQVQSPGGPPSPELTGRSRAQTLHHLLIEETPRYRPGGEEEQWSELFQGLIPNGGGGDHLELLSLASRLGCCKFGQLYLQKILAVHCLHSLHPTIRYHHVPLHLWRAFESASCFHFGFFLSTLFTAARSVIVKMLKETSSASCSKTQGCFKQSKILNPHHSQRDLDDLVPGCPHEDISFTSYHPNPSAPGAWAASLFLEIHAHTGSCLSNQKEQIWLHIGSVSFV